MMNKILFTLPLYVVFWVSLLHDTFAAQFQDDSNLDSLIEPVTDLVDSDTIIQTEKTQSGPSHHSVSFINERSLRDLPYPGV